MKIKRFLYPESRYSKRPLTVGWIYEARDVRGWIGLGRTPQKAVLDCRHEFRQAADHAEQGKCRQGRFHRA